LELECAAKTPRRNAQHFEGKAKSHICRRRQMKIALMRFLSGNRMRRYPNEQTPCPLLEADGDAPGY
jgi:hypothetical protein